MLKEGLQIDTTFNPPQFSLDHTSKVENKPHDIVANCASILELGQGHDQLQWDILLNRALKIKLFTVLTCVLKNNSKFTQKQNVEGHFQVTHEYTFKANIL